MQCHTPWTPRFLLHNGFTTRFLNKTLRDARERVLWDREQALLPATQPLAEALRAARTAPDDAHFRLARAKIRRLEAGLPPEGPPGPLALVQQRCPACPGFVLGGSWACGLCGTRVCCHCRDVVVSERGHACDPSAVASTAAVLADTRPCPRCAVRIYRMHGCDQMFCTACHTAFSWATGAIDTGPVHNPHFRATSSSPAISTACASTAVMPGAAYSQLEQDLPPLPHVLELGPPFPGLRRLVVELRATGKTVAPTRDNAMLRAAYLLHEMDAKEFRRRLFVEERARLRLAGQAQALACFCDQAAKILVSVDLDRDRMRAQLAQARLQCNQELEAVAEYAGGVPVCISEDLASCCRRGKEG